MAKKNKLCMERIEFYDCIDGNVEFYCQLEADGHEVHQCVGTMIDEYQHGAVGTVKMSYKITWIVTEMEIE